MLAHESPIPLYHQLLEIFYDYLNSGVWAPGEKIPTEKELTEEFKVSLITVRRALFVLEEEGRIVRKQGKGSFVSDRKMLKSSKGLDGVELFNIHDGKFDIQVIETTDSNVALKGKQRNCHIIRRKFLDDGEIICFNTITILQKYRDVYENLNSASADLSKKIAKSVPGCQLVTYHIDAIRLSEYEAEILHKSRGELALMIHQEYRTADDIVFVEKSILRVGSMQINLNG